MSRFFSISWWIYVFSATSWENFKCRFTGHKCGPVFFDADGDEPDMSCRNCGEEIG